MTWYGVLGHKDPIGDLRFRTQVCSEHLEDNDVKFVDSWTRTLKDGTHPLLFLWSTRGHMYFKDEFFIVSSKIIVGMDVSSEKKSGKNKLLQGLWKVREFHFEFGEIYIFEKSLEKVKFQVNVNLFILSWPSWWWKMETLSFLILINMYIVLNSWQIPEQHILFLLNTSWSWFGNEIMHFVFLQSTGREINFFLIATWLLNFSKW